MSKKSRKRISAVLAAAVIAISVLMPAKVYAQESIPAAGQETEAAGGSDIAGGEASDSAVTVGTADGAEEKDTSGSADENAGDGAQTVANDQEDAGNDAGAQEASDDAGDKGENAGAEV